MLMYKTIDVPIIVLAPIDKLDLDSVGMIEASIAADIVWHKSKSKSMCKFGAISKSKNGDHGKYPDAAEWPKRSSEAVLRVQP